jgi:MoxR-like ATPase
MVDPLRVEDAAARFRAFFDELKESFFEREDVLRQIALALLAKEHALITGPPGTAKSQLAHAVFGRIVCAETGSPSVYSRQITESTVQTDLIGPVDFKNLMETGRTTHFTDEGMLGASHTFLDEVFDGRDMLLRSALNVLEERELKQGTTVTRGQIEVALMTSNRYIADVLEQSRETLLAFVDRIAFVSFVPRGFAEPDNMQRVLARHVARSAVDGGLDALLTIQDVDVLQELVEEVVVSEPICSNLALLLDRMNTELSDAVRADPRFVPTRYLSTRTAVRCGRILRAIAVYDRIFERPERAQQVLPDDLPWLRLHLILTGPAPGEVDTLLARETDPHERRQLEIVRTEREIFDRCVAGLPNIELPPLSRKPTGSSKAAKTAPAKVRDDGPAPPPLPTRVEQLETELEKADGSTSSLVEILGRIAAVAAEGAPDAEHAHELLGRASRSLERTCARAALDASRTDADSLIEGVEQLVAVATTVQDDRVSMHKIAKGLRVRATGVIDEIARFAAGSRASDLAAAAPSARQASELCERRLAVFDRLANARRRIRNAEAPATEEQAAIEQAAWREALVALEDDLATLWDSAFSGLVQRKLAAEPDLPLPEVLDALQGELQSLDSFAERLEALMNRPSNLKSKAFGGRLSDLVEGLMRRAKLVDRKTLHEEIDAVLVILDAADLGHTITPESWLRWAAEALVEATRPPPEPVLHVYDHAGYRAVREEEERTPILYTLAEVANRVDREPTWDPSQVLSPQGLERISARIAELPDALVARVRELEVARLTRSTAYLEGWWKELTAGGADVELRLERVVRSRFFDVVWDEAALARTSLEASLVAELLPEAAASCQALRQRLQTLEDRTRRGAQALLRQRTDAAWAAAVGRE